MELRNTKEKTTNSQKQKIKKKSENIHKDHRARLKLQFLHNGFDSLTDVQKLELLLFYAIPQKDTNPLAHALLSEFGSLKNVILADSKNLMKVSGIKENTATLIKLVCNLSSSLIKPSHDGSIGSSRAAREFCEGLFVGSDVEQFYVICLAKSNRIKKVKLIDTGTMDEVNIQIREITELALDQKCNRIIIAHNHPNGKGKMSDEDCAFTYSLFCSCLLNSIDVVDHIIVGTDRTISLMEQGMIDKLRKRAFNTVKLSNETLAIISSASEEYIIDKS